MVVRKHVRNLSRMLRAELFQLAQGRRSPNLLSRSFPEDFDDFPTFTLGTRPTHTLLIFHRAIPHECPDVDNAFHNVHTLLSSLILARNSQTAKRPRLAGGEGNVQDGF